MSLDTSVAQMSQKTRVSVAILAAVAAAISHAMAAESGLDRLRLEFELPPASAMPRVWWHWMNGNVSEQGIKEDLEWMKRVGIGGAQTFDVSLHTPEFVNQRLVFMQPPWISAFKYSASLAESLGLELAIASAPGWSEAGGPWVASEQGMKKLVWSEISVDGGEVDVKLPIPPSVVGPFQDVPWSNPYRGGPGAREKVKNLYRDVAVIAYQLPDADKSLAELNPVVTSSAGPINANRLWDGSYSQSVNLPFGDEGNPAWIAMDFRHPLSVQAMSLALQEADEFVPPHVAAELQSSADGRDFHTIVTVGSTSDVQQTVAFPPVRARFFRLLFPSRPPRSVPTIFESVAAPPQTQHKIYEFILHVTPRIDHFEQKAAFFIGDGSTWEHVSPSGAAAAIPLKSMLDLTPRLRPDGSLNWRVPHGRWEILRLGYSLLGTVNMPAAAEATGLEVDKLSASDVRSYMDRYVGLYESILGDQPAGKRGLRAMVMDSWEAGPQNWTDDLPQQFLNRRGYELGPWLPALTGRVMESAESTERFLWDFRRTLGDLLRESYYGQVAASLSSHQLTHYGESHEVGRAFIGDGMDAKLAVDIPMGAMWGVLLGQSQGHASQSQGDADIRESASAAHIMGRNLVAAESMTATGTPGTAYSFAPADLKSTADREFVDGVTRVVIHTSVHQPLNRVGPGLALGQFGQWFTRNETWAEQSRPWMTYLSRSSYLLQQGQFVADVLYFYGQDSNITALYADHLPPVPEGYAFDFANDSVLKMLSVRQGELITSSEMSYRILALAPRTRMMSLDVLKQIARLVSEGATVVGEKPQATPSLADDELEFQRLADAVWGPAATLIHRYGEGLVLWGTSSERMSAALGISSDFSYSKPKPDSEVWYVHRRMKDADIYFVDNRLARAEHIEAKFRVTGKIPELWFADTGAIERASYQETGDETAIPLDMEPNGSVFVVFRGSAELKSQYVPAKREVLLDRLSGPWRVGFQSNRGAPQQTTFGTLKSWTENPDSGIKYFSGTATYMKFLNISPSVLSSTGHIYLDLGVVKDIAEVRINGRSCGITWKPPFRADVTDALKPGRNELEIAVTNLWPNRLIGDRQPGAQAVAFTSFNPYTADSKLLTSGLLGPVSLLRIEASAAVNIGPIAEKPR